MEKVNESYKPKYKACRVGRTDLVWARGLGLVQVDPGESVYKGPAWPHDEWMMLYTYWVGGVKDRIWGEQWYRPPTFWEFCLYRHPKTRGLRIGANSAWPLLFANAIAIAGLFLNGWPTDVWTALVLAVCIGIPALTIIGTLRNYHGKQF